MNKEFVGNNEWIMREHWIEMNAVFVFKWMRNRIRYQFIYKWYLFFWFLRDAFQSMLNSLLKQTERNSFETCNLC